MVVYIAKLLETATEIVIPMARVGATNMKVIGLRPLAPATIRQSSLMLMAMDSILLTALMVFVLTSTVMV